MAKNLLIVESPAKAKTIQKYLGPDFMIMASVGHIKDLPVNRLGVDIENGFRPEYVTIKGKGKVLKTLREAGKKAEAIYLAPDPDREGEAIAWHIAEELKNGKRRILRVLFNELTRKAVRDAVASPQALNRDRFESQQARRILDRIVGYQISPLLWTKVKRGLSAGRVQSVAVKMICDREREIYAFEPREYWTLTAHLKADDPPPFEARLFRYHGKKIELKTGAQTQALVSEIKGLPFRITGISRKKRKRYPPPPFTTSLLQQESFKRLRFSPKKTMAVAQGLYEGVELGDRGQAGLITYMRTDSFRISDDALSQARAYIGETFGNDYLPSRPNRFKSRKGAQEAHEAIRPTSMELDPETVAQFLNKDQLALYSLIWNRFIACQMTPAILEQTQVEIEAGQAGFRASGSVVVFRGFMVMYKETAEEPAGRKNGDDKLLPPLREGDTPDLVKLDPVQHFTQPPPRFTAASLIKALEENGIGRPSTYASILANISGREYVTTEKRRFRPTELGFLVTDLLVGSFPDILDAAFTAQMETQLDRIEQGKVNWVDVLKGFYDSFKKELDRAERDMKGEVPTDIRCPECRSPMAIKSGKNGIFLACTRYPECRSTSNFTRDEKGRIVMQKTPAPEAKGICDLCGREMVVKNGKFGPFIACSGYPECKNTRPLDSNGADRTKTDVPCPDDGCSGTLVQRRSRKGRIFYACNRYPECRFMMWDEPFDGTCPECGTKVMGIRQKKGEGAVLVCRQKGCNFTRPL